MSHEHDNTFDAREYRASKYDGTPLADRKRGRLALDRKRVHHALLVHANREVADRLLAPAGHVDPDAFDTVLWSSGSEPLVFKVLANRLVDEYLPDECDLTEYTSRW